MDNLSFAETLDSIELFIRSGMPHRHVAVNVNKILRVRADSGLRQIIEEADLASIDGQPVIWAARVLGGRMKGRVAGIDLMQALITRAEERGWRVYFLGATGDVLAELIARYRVRHPALRIAGYHHGYWRTEDEEKGIVEQIRMARPDILFVGVGSPTKEVFGYQHADRMGVPFVMGVGGSFDVIAGVTRRAPVWMQRVGLEWFWRFLQEPRRMWRRYLIDGIKFVSLVAREVIRGRRISS
jgi:N-acetylglucosaminyldiphosphoundecaprenol N-acetyl-beta-D-mannosaminyltransferase